MQHFLPIVTEGDVTQAMLINHSAGLRDAHLGDQPPELPHINTRLYTNQHFCWRMMQVLLLDG